jgi:magnesium and cobalt transporter
MNDTDYHDDTKDHSTAPRSGDNNKNGDSKASESKGILRRLTGLFRGKHEANNLRDAVEEYIEEGVAREEDDDSIDAHERALLSNILKLRDLTVVDVMIPRADIIAVDISMSQKDLLSLLAEKQYSRIPVYRDNMDDIIGTIHIKDILASLAAGKRVEMEELMRSAPIVSPAMQVLDLLLMMRQRRKHMALVVDEYGGIDGLVTIGDVIEAIVGEIDDEYDQDDDPQIITNKDGTITADGRYDIEEFEEEYGSLLEEDEDDEVDTIGGYLLFMAGRIPTRGEILTHDSGVVFEVLDADPRRVNRVIIKNVELLKNTEDDEL